MTKLKAFRIFSEEGKATGRFVEMNLDELDPGEVVVEVACSSVNFKDALAGRGAGSIVRRFPCVGGIDLSGRVVESSDPRFEPGDEVLATGYDLSVTHDGGYAELCRIPADWLVPLPEGLDLHEAMAIGTAGYTAGLALVRMEHDGLAPGNGPVIVTGATGGVGSIAVDILASAGYEVVALTGKEDAAEYLRTLGAARVMLHSELDLTRIRPLDKATWAGAVDNVGGDVLAWIASRMLTAGTIASIGLAASHELKTTVMPFILRGVSLLGIDSAYTKMAVRRRVWERLANDLRPRHLMDITTTIGFDQLPAAFDQILARKAKGRTVVKVRE
jgi:putative YhdH/YhfP family quinone oxidoreductase